MTFSGNIIVGDGRGGAGFGQAQVLALDEYCQVLLMSRCSAV